VSGLCSVRGGELPPEQRRVLARALRLEWISLGFFATALVFTGLVMGQSQALKTSWIDTRSAWSRRSPCWWPRGCGGASRTAATRTGGIGA